MGHNKTFHIIASLVQFGVAYGTLTVRFVAATPRLGARFAVSEEGEGESQSIVAFSRIFLFLAGQMSQLSNYLR